MSSKAIILSPRLYKGYVIINFSMLGSDVKLFGYSLDLETLVICLSYDHTSGCLF